MSTPRSSTEGEVTLNNFTLWRKPALQAFLRKRDIPCSGSKPELIALAYSATVMGLPLKQTKEEKITSKAKEYQEILTVNGKKLPDPLSDLKFGWEDEKEAMAKWPCSMIHDLSDHLKKHETDIEKASLRKRLLCDYKEGKAFSYFSSQYLFGISYNDVDPNCAFCFLKTKCRPSYAVHDDPHDVWVCIEKKTGTIQSAYCSCFAGLGQSCNHVAALMLKVDFCWKHGLVNPSCTSLPCTWKAGGKSVITLPREIDDMQWKAPHAERLDQSKVINPARKALFSPTVRQSHKGMNFETFLDRLEKVHPRSVILAERYQDRRTIFDVNATKTPLCPPLPPLVTDLAQQCSSVDEIVKNCTISLEAVKVLNQATLGQSENEVWISQRQGRLTASKFHDIFTRVNTYQRNPEGTDMTSLVATVMGYTSVNPFIPALKYGRNMEAIARQAYCSLMTKTHKDFKITEAGLILEQNTAYLGASPDAFIECECCGKGVLEIKCPLSVSHEVPTVKNVPYLVQGQDGPMLRKNSKYYDQCQGQLGVTRSFGVHYCDFYVHTMHGFHNERIEFDNERWSKLKVNCVFFFQNILCTELLNKTVKAKFGQINLDDDITTDNQQHTASVSTQPTVQPVKKRDYKKSASKQKRGKRNARPVYLCPECRKECAHVDSVDSSEPMVEPSIGCDSCFSWFHYPCVGLTEAPEHVKWYCPRCKS